MVEEEGYILKQIKAVAKAIAKILFNRDSYDYVLPKDGKYNQYDNLYLTIMGLADNNKFNAAEIISSSRELEQVILEYGGILNYWQITIYY